MRVFVTGQTGFIGQRLVPMLEKQGHTLVAPEDRPHAMIHLAWRGLPYYENPAQLENVGWQFKLIEMLAQMGVTNVTVPGTCWELCPKSPPYVLAKQELMRKLQELSITLKWVRAPYLYGPNQKPNCLLPTLQHAVHDGAKEFHVVHGSLPFLHVDDFAQRLIDGMNDDRAQVANIPGVWENVANFCRRHLPPGYEMNFIPDYPRRPWEA